MAIDTPEFEQLELANVGEGKLELQFQEAVLQAYAIFQESTDGGRYEIGAGGNLVCSIDMQVSLDLDLESRTLTVGSRVSKFSPPKRKRIYRQGYMRSGTVLVERAVQDDLPLAGNVRPISAEEGAS